MSEGSQHKSFIYLHCLVRSHGQILRTAPFQELPNHLIESLSPSIQVTRLQLTLSNHLLGGIP